jgi:hypothetical protein
MLKLRSEEMSKSRYKEVCGLVNEIIELHKSNGVFSNEYARTVGNLTAIVGMMIDGTLTKDEGFKALVKTRDNLMNMKESV